MFQDVTSLNNHLIWVQNMTADNNQNFYYFYRQNIILTQYAFKFLKKVIFSNINSDVLHSQDTCKTSVPSILCT